MSNVINLFPDSDPDLCLDGAKAKYKELIIIGWNIDDILEVRGTKGLDEEAIIYLFERFKHSMLSGELIIDDID